MVVGLYPPWRYTQTKASAQLNELLGTLGESGGSAGHHLIFDPPSASGREFKIDLARLLILWTCVAVATLVIVVIYPNGGRKTPDKPL